MKVIATDSQGTEQDAGTFEFDVLPDEGDYVYLRDGRRAYVLQRQHRPVGNRMEMYLLVSPQ